jgi:steroid delta-isomerase-like uncharacterized protein
MANENIAAIEAAVEKMNTGDLEGYLELYAENVVLHGYPPGVEGKAGANAFYTSFAKALPDIRITIEDVMAEGDKVAARFKVQGTHSDELMGVPATGNSVDVEGQSFFRFENGQITERWQSLDAMTLMTQLGALPAPS